MKTNAKIYIFLITALFLVSAVSGYYAALKKYFKIIAPLLFFAAIVETYLASYLLSHAK